MNLVFSKVRSPKILISAAIAFMGFSAFAQSPGGVSSNLTLWLKADNAASISNSPFLKWTTSGGSVSGYTVYQDNAPNMPTLVDGATNYSQFNYNPTFKFNADAKTELYSNPYLPDLLGNNGTAIIVTNQVGPGTGIHL